jgi:cyclophilin family peptidyl-prolyl cis-trans isomerase
MVSDDKRSNTTVMVFDASLVFLCTASTPWLDDKHVVFGKVISGLDVVSAIEQVGSESGRTRVQGKLPVALVYR